MLESETMFSRADEHHNDAVSIKIMQRHHLDAVAAIEKQTPHGHWKREQFAAEFTKPITHAFVALKKKRVAGFIIGWIVADELQIGNLAVARDFQRRGIASQLLATLLKQGKLHNVGHAFLEVRASNKAAIRLYEKNGFQTTGMRKSYYSNPVEDALLMSL